ncbi:TetR/AcrR family transcriptional regulator [Brevibacterium aurantiacum]|uniref:TetR/AcrR family transcriptional regulator n=1 Tax=Brevibacterium aurantiacum TaxID=273384 RepID=UPI001642484E|nr:TetR/AcrR family transcriptional regulator [Brevibacterium aurantiacum]
MPKIVNVEEHRARIAAAVWRVIAARGLDAVSLRSVAVEAKVSMGQVQHYYSLKNDLLFAGVEHSYLLIEQHLEQLLAEAEGSPREVMLAILTVLLGEEAVVRDAIRVNVAFAARTQNEPRIHDLLTSGDDEIIGLCTHVLAQAQRDGHLNADLDPVAEARLLFGLATGLGTQVAVYGGSSAQALDVFTYHLRRLGISP